MLPHLKRCGANVRQVRRSAPHYHPYIGVVVRRGTNKGLKSRCGKSFISPCSDLDEFPLFPPIVFALDDREHPIRNPAFQQLRNLRLVRPVRDVEAHDARHGVTGPILRLTTFAPAASADSGLDGVKARRLDAFEGVGPSPGLDRAKLI